MLDATYNNFDFKSKLHQPKNKVFLKIIECKNRQKKCNTYLTCSFLHITNANVFSFQFVGHCFDAVAKIGQSLFEIKYLKDILFQKKLSIY